MNGTTHKRIYYDVFCQWIVHFFERVEKSKYLSIPTGMKIDGGIGMFHMGQYILQCFPQFSLHFLLGSGQVDGEILETLWSSLNHVAGSTWAMSCAHRQEVLDMHMNDSNWRKLVSCGMY